MKKDTLLVEEDQAALKMTSAVVTGVSDSSEEDVEKSVTEAEISEHLSGVSSDLPPHKQDYFDKNERTLNSEYSEDFERSLSTTDRESVEGRAESCACSGAHPSSASSPSVTRERRSRGRRVTVTETAVQTAEPPFTYRWAKGEFSSCCPRQASFTLLYMPARSAFGRVLHFSASFPSPVLNKRFSKAQHFNLLSTEKIGIEYHSKKKCFLLKNTPHRTGGWMSKC